ATVRHHSRRSCHRKTPTSEPRPRHGARTAWRARALPAIAVAQAYAVDGAGGSTPAGAGWPSVVLLPAFDRPPADVVAVELARPRDAGDFGIGLALRIGDVVAQCAHAQHATASGDHVFAL